MALLQYYSKFDIHNIHIQMRVYICIYIYVYYILVYIRLALKGAKGAQILFLKENVHPSP